MIVRYKGNRRLWDTDNHRFVTLVELGQQIAAGEDIKVYQVIGRRRYEDISARVYADMLQLKAHEGAVPFSVGLRRLVRAAFRPKE